MSRHAHAVAQGVHRSVHIVLGKGSQFCLGFRVVQQHLGIAEHGHVIVGLVHTSPFREGFVHHKLHHLVTGDAAPEVRRADGFVAQPHVSGAYGDGRQTGIAALHLVHILHGFPSGLVREAGAVGHEHTGYKLTREAGRALGGHHGKCRGVVADLQALVVLDGQDEFVLVGVYVGKELTVVVHLGQRVRAVLHDFAGGSGGQTQVVGGAAAVGRKVHHVHFRMYSRAVVLAEGAFEQAETGLQGQRRPAVHAIGAHRSRQMFNGIVDIIQHMAHHHFAAVARTVQVVGVGLQLLVNPRDIAKTYHHVKVEVGAEEAREGRVLHHGILVLALADVFQQGVHLAEVAPGAGAASPSTAAVGNGAGIAAAQEGRQVQAHQLVALLAVRFLVEQVVIEGIGEQLQVGLVPEIVLRGQGVLGRTVQELAAGGKAGNNCDSR